MDYYGVLQTISTNHRVSRLIPGKMYCVAGYTGRSSDIKVYMHDYAASLASSPSGSPTALLVYV